MAAQELKDYLENGNIQNSVNLPTLVQPWSGVSRLCIIHRNAPGAIASITGVLSKDGVNVANMTNKSKKDYAYTVVDVDSRIGESVADTIRAWTWCCGCACSITKQPQNAEEHRFLRVFFFGVRQVSAFPAVL